MIQTCLQYTIESSSPSTEFQLWDRLTRVTRKQPNQPGMDTNKSNLFEMVMALTREEEEEARGGRHNGVPRDEVGHKGAPEVDIRIGQREREEEDQNAVEEGARGGRQADHPVGDHLEQEDLHKGGRSDKRRDQQARSVSQAAWLLEPLIV